MAKVIEQETFDAVVRENMEELEMEAKEAVEDAVSQFEAQGVNLANIVRDLSLYSGPGGEQATHTVVQAIDSLTAGLNSENNSDMRVHLETVKRECDVDIAHRLLAGKNGAYSIVLRCCKRQEKDPETFLVCIETFCSFFKGQPDLIDSIGMTYLMAMLKDQIESWQIVAALIRAIRLTCVMHEGNRQFYVEEGLVRHLVSALSIHKDSSEVVIEVCMALRILVADDDVRVPFGKGHEHAKMIVIEEDAIKKIMAICKDFKDSKNVMGELFTTLGRLAVRDEFCQEIMDLGGLQLMLAALEHNMQHKYIVQRALGVMKAIAGNDKVKIAIANNNGIELILAAMTKHQRNAVVAELGCSALATVCLRQPTSCERLVKVGGPEVICKVMQLHPAVCGAQKQACMAIRNVVARNETLCPAFLELDVEALLQRALQAHATLKDEAKAALRDLGCKVDLEIRWKGEGRGISR